MDIFSSKTGVAITKAAKATLAKSGNLAVRGVKRGAKIHLDQTLQDLKNPRDDFSEIAAKPLELLGRCAQTDQRHVALPSHTPGNVRL